mmetsp:Transcript_88303/g.258102  ORF Transcript_88303/g.258102 Transcript_88303/m.258102 type:complete len:442 (+) Transcript_88303:108-1433(+)
MFVAALAFLVCLLVATLDRMPHSHSALSRAARRQRALARGYIETKPSGMTHVLVPSPLAQPVRTAARALEAHAALDSISGVRHHHLAHAALTAKPIIGDSAFVRIMALNREAGRAKHGVSQSVMPQRSPWADEVDDSLSGAAVSGDPWQCSPDPWAAALARTPLWRPPPACGASSRSDSEVFALVDAPSSSSECRAAPDLFPDASVREAAPGPALAPLPSCGASSCQDDAPVGYGQMEDFVRRHVKDVVQDVMMAERALYDELKGGLIKLIEDSSANGAAAFQRCLVKYDQRVEDRFCAVEADATELHRQQDRLLTPAQTESKQHLSIDVACQTQHLAVDVACQTPVVCTAEAGSSTLLGALSLSPPSSSVAPGPSSSSSWLHSLRSSLLSYLTLTSRPFGGDSRMLPRSRDSDDLQPCCTARASAESRSRTLDAQVEARL